MFRMVALIAVLVSLPAFGQDFTQVFAERGSRGSVPSERDTGVSAPGRGEADGAGLRVAVAELRQEAADLKAELETLRSEYQQLSHAYGDLVRSRSRVRGINVLSAGWCKICVDWHKADEETPPMLLKRWIDADGAMPPEMDPAEWTLVQAKWHSIGRKLPLVWWRDKSGQIQFLEGRFTDRQIVWSMGEADIEADRRAPAAPVPPAVQPKAPLKTRLGAIARLGVRPW